jgi:hypothetical protein
MSLWLVTRYPRLAARVGWTAVKHPRRTAIVIAAARQAPDVARRTRAAVQDPEVKKQFKTGSDALGKAARRLRDSEQPADALGDQKLHAELRRAAAAMAMGYAAASHPKKRRRRLGRTVLAVGMVGAGAYAGYRVVRETRQNGAEPMPAADAERDETLAASFPASDPPPGPAV